MACKVGLAIYSIMQFIAFLFVLVGTPIDMFRLRGEDTIGNKSCLTLWGLKVKCYSTKYDLKNNEYWISCEQRRNRFRAAEAFAIISIAVYGVAALIGFIQLCCCSCLRWLCLVLNIIGIATACITWALMVDAYTKPRDAVLLSTCSQLKLLYKYGAGFALIVLGWCLDIIGIFFLMLPY